MMLERRNKEIDELNRTLKAEQEKAYENAKRAAELEKEKAREKKEWEEKVDVIEI